MRFKFQLRKKFSPYFWGSLGIHLCLYGMLFKARVDAPMEKVELEVTFVEKKLKEEVEQKDLFLIILECSMKSMVYSIIQEFWRDIKMKEL